MASSTSSSDTSLDLINKVLDKSSDGGERGGRVEILNVENVFDIALKERYPNGIASGSVSCR